jgi:hypothetical protein
MRTFLPWWPALLAGCDVDAAERLLDAPERSASASCRAEYQARSVADGVVVRDDVGLDVYDEARPDRLLHRWRDFDADGTVDLTVDHRYDDDGRLVERESLHVGYLPLREEWWFDDAGRPLAYWRDEVDDGAPDHVEAWSRDPSGQREERRIDRNGDGRPESVVTSTWDPDGRVAERRTTDLDGARVSLEAVTWFDDDGSSEVSLDADGDGVVDERVVSIVDARGHVAYESRDRTPDLAGYDEEIARTWDPELGLPLTVDAVYVDPVEPGEAGGSTRTATSTEVYTYDPLGRPLSFVRQWHEPATGFTQLDTLRWTFGGACP